MKSKLLMAVATILISMGTMHSTIANAKSGWYWSDMYLSGATPVPGNSMYLNCNYNYYLMFSGMIYNGPYAVTFIEHVYKGCAPVRKF